MSQTVTADRSAANGTRQSRPRVAIIGAGMIASVHRRSALVAGAHLVGVLSSSPQSTGAVAQSWQVRAFDSFDAVLASNIDVLHICTPNATHAEYTLRALAAGCNVICEKPLGVTLEQAQMMTATAKDSGLVATVPFVYRYHPVVRELRARLRSGELGALNFIHGSYLQDWMLDAAAGGWRVGRDSGGASRAFADIGSHWCDLVEWVSGERFTSVSAVTSIAHAARPAGKKDAHVESEKRASLERVDTEDIAVATFLVSSGALANVTISQVAAGRKNRLWFELDGAAGSAVFDQERPESIWLGGGAGESRILVRDPASSSEDARRLSSLPAGHPQGYQQCFDNFVADTYAAVFGAAPDGLPSFADGLRTAHIVEAFLTSSRNRIWTDI